jgi:hypothetical protein
MKTNSRFSARLPLLLLLLSCVAGSLSSCRDSAIEASRQRRDSHAEAAEVKKQHRAELKELNARIASLEAGKEEAGDPFAIEPPPLPPEELAPEPPSAVAAEPDEEEDSLDARDRRKIGTYQQKGLAGVPPEISAEIVRRARRDTRNWAALDEIDAQSEGYRTVQAFAVTDTKMLREERDELVFAVKRQFPNDWASMAREIHAQTDAWKVLEEWKVTGVPGLRPWESIAVLEAAANRYPFDWKAAIADVAEQSQKEVQARRSASAGK